jgi:hypothetical protein
VKQPKGSLDTVCEEPMNKGVGPCPSSTCARTVPRAPQCGASDCPSMPTSIFNEYNECTTAYESET